MTPPAGHPIISPSGIPSAVMVFRILHPNLTSTLWDASPLARIAEPRMDELCTFIGNKSTTVWLFATIEVSSRLWASSVLGRRSDRNARAVIDDVICRGRVVGCPLIATDGWCFRHQVLVKRA